MSKSSYAETDDKTLADDPNAPSGEVDFNKRYTTRANEPMPVMGDTKPGGPCRARDGRHGAGPTYGSSHSLRGISAKEYQRI